MSNIDADLLLHLALDEIRDGKFPDASGNGRDGVVKGNVTLVADDVFGACAGFDGALTSFIEVPDSADLRITGDLTIEAWINISQEQSNWVRVVGKGLSNRNYGLWYGKSWGWLFQRMSGSAYQDCLIPPSRLPWRMNTWLHMAGVLRGNVASLYIHDAQGRFLLQQPQQLTVTGPPQTGAEPLTIGYSGYGNSHKGKIANVRVYKRALSQAEIERDIREDCMSLVAFRKSHPIDFRLFDEDEQAVLYITDDKAGHDLNLELRNSSTQAIQLSNGQPAASETNHHFALRFRPGTLSDNTINALVDPAERAKILKQPAEWDLYFPAEKPAANETVSLYLLYKGGSKSLQPDERRSLTLQGMSAAPGSGSRGTQVELIPRQLTAAGGDATPITGSRTQYLHVTNQIGKKNIPLHVGFVGGNNVLNDGATPNTLNLRITNVSKDGAITLNAKSHNEPSEFIISFDAQPPGKTMEWALVKTGNSGAVKVKVINRTTAPPPDANGPILTTNPLYKQVVETEREIAAVGIQGETPEWPITFDTAITLAAGEHIHVRIENIVSSLPTGHANIYVRYKNIPGYWDGQFVCPVEKGPIVYDGAKVKIAGSVVAKSLSVSEDNNYRGALFFASANDFNHAIYNNFTNVDGKGKWDGATWNTGSGLRLRVGNGDQKKAAITVDEAGNVGIGKDCIGAPGKDEWVAKNKFENKLEVEGTVKATKFEGEGAFVKGMIIMWSGPADKIPTGWALCDGKNGTPNLAEKFIVAAGGKYKAGETGGAESVKLEIKHMPRHNHPNSVSSNAGEHTHTIRSSQHGWAFGDIVQSGDPRSEPLMDPPTAKAGAHTHSLTITAEGGDEAHENRPPYYAMAFIMKT